jgi:hypothetical protein
MVEPVSNEDIEQLLNPVPVAESKKREARA